MEVVYSMDLSKHSQDISIAVGILAAVAVLYSAFQAFNWNRRHGLVAIGCSTILQFILITAGTLGNAFVVVILGSSVWWLLIYKVG